MFAALGDGDGGEAVAVFTDDHLVAVLHALGRAARDDARVNLLLEVGQQGLRVAHAEHVRLFLFNALVLNLTQLFNIFNGLDALATSGPLQFVGNIHQVAGQRALAGTGQVGELVAGLRAAQTAETSAVDGRTGDHDFLGVASDADQMSGRIDFDKLVGSAADLSDDLVLGVLDDVHVLERQFHIVDLDLHLGGVDDNLLIVQKDGDNLQL